MPTPRRYADNAERQAAYRARLAMQPESQPTPPRTPSAPGNRRWDAMIEEARSLLAGVACEMEAYFDERSDGWRCSERGETFTQRREMVQEITGLLEDLA
jgi:hypothetical protein